MSEGPVELTDRQQIERRADVVRTKLSRTLAALERKSYEALHVGERVGRHATGVAIAAAVAAFALGALTVALAMRVARPEQRRRAYPEPGPSLVKRTVVAILTAVARRAAKIAVSRLLTSPRARDVAIDAPPARRAIELR
jgi:hypothetical protein